ncbi:MAG: HAAS signaling domain-containing protein [Betaproteobacteria bacterium]
MRDDAALIDAIDRIVAGAGVPGRAARDDLRRELEAHFEDACADLSSAAALRRFGSPAEVTAALRRVYRRDVFLLAAARVGATLAVSAAAALAIEAAANLRPGAVWRLAPGFSYAAPVAVVVALALVGLREASRCARRPWKDVAHRSASWLAAFAAFAAGEYLLHLARSVPFGAARALSAGAVLLAVWGASLLIARRVDRAFDRRLGPA